MDLPRKPTARTAIALSFAGLAVLVLAAFLLAPRLVNPDRIETQIAAGIESLIGREVAIDDPPSVVMGWNPTLSVTGLRILPGTEGNDGAATGGDGPGVAEIRIEVGLLPLLAGDVEIRSLHLVEPVLTLDTQANGAPNRSLEALAAALGAAGGALHRVSVGGGRLLYRDRDAGIDQELDDVAFTLTVPPAGGVHRVSGKARWYGLPVTWTVSVNPSAPDGAAVEARFESDGTIVAFNGEASPAPGEGLEGRATLRSEGPALARALAAVSGIAPAAPAGMEVEARARVRYRAGRLAAEDVALRLGGAAVEGALTAARGRLDLALAASRLDLDRLLAAFDASPPEENRVEDPAPGLPRALAGLRGNIDIAVDALLYRERILRQVALDIALDAGAAIVRRLEARLPGGSEVSLSGSALFDDGAPVFDGRIDVESDNLRTLMPWFGIDPSGIPADRLRRFGFGAALKGGLRSGRIADIAAHIDTTAIAGSAAWAFRRRPAFDLDLDLDRLDLDAYLPRGENGIDLARLAAALAAFDAGLAFDIGALTVAGVSAQGVAVSGTLENGALALHDARIDDLAGGAASITGTISDLDSTPSFDGAIRFRTDDAPALARAVPALRDLPRAAVPLSLEAALAGGAEAIEINAAFRARDSTAAVQGTVADPLGTPLYELSATLVGSDLARLLEPLDRHDGMGAASLLAGPVSMNVGIDGTASAMTFQAGAALHGGELSVHGRIEGDETARRFDLEAQVRHPDLGRLLHAARGAAEPPAPGGRLAGPVSGVASAAGDTERVAFDAALELAGGALSLAGDIEGLPDTPSWALTGALDHPDMAALSAGLGIRTAFAQMPGALGVRARLAGGETGLEIRDLDAALGDTRMTGRVALELSTDRPRLTGDLTFDRLDAAWFLPVAAASDEELWSREPIDLSALRGFDARLTLAAGALHAGGYLFEDADLALALADGALDVESLAGRLFGGAAVARGRLEAGAVPRLSGTVEIDDADLGLALDRLAGIGSVSGSIDAALTFSTEGATERRMILALDGDGALSGAGGGRIDGFDLAAVSAAIGAALDTRRVPDLSGLAEGRTDYSDLAGSFRIANGRLSTTDLRLTADAAVADVAVEANLVTWRHKATATVGFAGYADLPSLVLYREGPIDAPRRRSDARDATGFIQSRDFDSIVDDLLRD